MTAIQDGVHLIIPGGMVEVVLAHGSTAARVAEVSPRAALHLVLDLVQAALERTDLHDCAPQEQAPPERRGKPALASDADHAEVDAFLSARCSIAARPADASVRAGELHGAYCEWSKASARPHRVQIRQFKQVLERRFARKQSDGIWWIGLRLRGSETTNSAMDGLQLVGGTDARQAELMP